MNPAWTPTENAALAALYFALLDWITDAGAPRLNKRALIRYMQGDGDTPTPPSLTELRGSLRARSRGSIEAKLMNASAAHADIAPDAETMAEHGYRPLSRYQSTLRDAIASQMSARGEHRAAVAAYFRAAS